MAQRTIAVTGASGFVGRHVVKELVRRGHDVRALARDEDKARRSLGAQPLLVKGDVTDQATLDHLVDGADAVIHLVGIIREAPGGQTFERMHVLATERTLGAATRAGARRFLQMSALGVGAEGVCEYQRTKYRAEQLVRDSSLDWTIFRPSLIHGLESEFVQMVAGWVRGKGVPGTRLPYFTRSVEDTSVFLGPIRAVDPVVAPVYVDDVAYCFAEALDRDVAIGEIYNLAGPDEMTFPRMLVRYRDAVKGARSAMTPLGIRENVAAMGAKAAKALKLDSLLPFDEGMALMGSRDSVAELDKAESHLSWAPSPFQARLASYAGSL
jgi:NADH dehydrogenase